MLDQNSPARPLTLIHFTDTHIAADQPFLNIDSYSKLRNAIAAVQAMETRPDAVIISGDLTHNGNEAAYIRFKELVDEIENTFHVPVLMAMGNHDFRVPFRSIVLGIADSDENAPYYYSQMIGDVRVIVLDSKVPGKEIGFIDPEQLAWLAKELATPVAGGNIVVLHHPPLPNPIMPQDHVLSNAAELGAILRGQPIHAILCGHIHFHSIGLFNGILCAAGTGVAFTLDPSATQGLRMLNGSGFNLIAIRDGVLTVNTIEMPGEQTLMYYYKPAEHAPVETH